MNSGTTSPGNQVPTGLTYRDAGVDLDAGATAKKRIIEMAERTLGPGVLSTQGGFGGVIDPGANSETLLVASTDGVGTKLRIAQALGRHNTVGKDIVNHCINDILPTGATPLFFLDYIGLPRFDETLLAEIVEGLSEACLEAGCALLGGETASMPDVYHGSDYDLVGFIVGTVQRERLIEPENTSEGDVLIGLPSSGLHTNGYSLVRKVYGVEDDPSELQRELPDDGRTLGEALLEPHMSYLPVLKQHMAHVKGLGHITGGGIFKNIPRVVADGLAAEVDLTTWSPPVLFRDIQEAGKIDDLEMFRVFNMGLGMVVIVDEKDADNLLGSVEGSWVVGRLTKQTSDQRVITKGL